MSQTPCGDPAPPGRGRREAGHTGVRWSAPRPRVTMETDRIRVPGGLAPGGVHGEHREDGRTDCRCRPGRADRRRGAAAARHRLPHRRPAACSAAVREGGGHPAAHPGDLGPDGPDPGGTGRGRTDARAADVRQRHPAGPDRPRPAARGAVRLLRAPPVRDRAHPRGLPGPLRDRDRARDRAGVLHPGRRRGDQPARGLVRGRERGPLAVPGGLRRRAQHRPQDPGAHLRGRRLPGGVHARRRGGRLGHAAGLRHPCPAPRGGRRGRRSARLHPAARPLPVPDVDAGTARAVGRSAGRGARSGRGRRDARPGERARPRSHRHPGRPGPDVAAADRRLPDALVLGVPDQPPAGGPVRRRAGLRRRGRRAHPSADGRAGHEHRHPGRLQPGLETGARGQGHGPSPTARELRRRTPAGR